MSTTTIFVNGSPSGELKLERGLRQDPLSPFLYLLVEKGLSCLLSRAVEQGMFEPKNIRNDNLRIAHLQYDDDTILLGAGHVENVHAMRYLLKYFELLSWLKVNYIKC